MKHSTPASPTPPAAADAEVKLFAADGQPVTSGVAAGSPPADGHPNSADGGAALGKDLAKEVDQVAELTGKLAALQDKMLRTQADLDNYRKRMAREKDEAVKYANTDLLAALLPVIDNFELGLQAAEQGGDAKSILLGMQMVKTQLTRFLTDSGVAVIESVGRQFDPHLHEALSQQESADHADGVILSQQRKGYQLKDRLLRPAAVVVARQPGKA
ncbi:MAG: nucleotide exchange factor GrpE [Verrucomicrobiales bacterium]|jgi:molecular chaperone GrpE|nr:nucleotide exchange factor GrpE [Verrucomicrobiales bacterium]